MTNCQEIQRRKRAKMKKQNVIEEKLFEFAVRMVRVYQYLADTNREFVLSKQMLRGGTSIGANVSEAGGAISRADFSNKISIAYNECLETKCWIRLLGQRDFMKKKGKESFCADADEIGKILFSILKATRIRKDSDR